MNTAPTVPAYSGGVAWKMAMLVRTKTVAVPDVPMMNAGKTSGQYWSRRWAEKGSMREAAKVRVSPLRMRILGRPSVAMRAPLIMKNPPNIPIGKLEEI